MPVLRDPDKIRVLLLKDGIKVHISGVTFRNIAVLHNFHKPVMHIHKAGSAAGGQAAELEVYG